MSISKAKKARQKLARQGRPAADLLRGSWQGMHPVTKRTPSLQEKQAKLNRKHRRNHAYTSDDSFFIYRGRETAVAVLFNGTIRDNIAYGRGNNTGRSYDPYSRRGGEQRRYPDGIANPEGDGASDGGPNKLRHRPAIQSYSNKNSLNTIFRV